MCPSYMVTREEEHSTRGRSRMLFEMLQGEVITDGWKSKEVMDALDLCLACKGCKGDCPVNVDMATYKAEFLSHYYEGRLRPRHAYAMGLIMYWARLASKFPELVNFVNPDSGLEQSCESCWRASRKTRKLPTFAPQTFKDWFRQRGRPQRGQAGGDSLARYIQQLLHSARRVKQRWKCSKHAGYRVLVPQKGSSAAGGRSMTTACSIWRSNFCWRIIIDFAAGDPPRATPIVGTGAELRRSFPGRIEQSSARRRGRKPANAAGVHAGRVSRKTPGLQSLRGFNREAIVHIHCHHNAIMGAEAEAKLLKRYGAGFDPGFGLLRHGRQLRI